MLKLFREKVSYGICNYGYFKKYYGLSSLNSIDKLSSKIINYFEYYKIEFYKFIFPEYELQDSIK